MPLTTLRSPPAVSDFTPLAEYQSQTPESFSAGKPVLYYHGTAAVASIPESQSQQLPIFSTGSQQSSELQTNGHSETASTREQTVDIFVNSENLILFSSKAELGIAITYPNISIHAIKQAKPSGSDDPLPSVWMQLDFSDGGADDEEFDTVELTLILPASDSSNEEASEAAASQLYNAIAACSNLHPDPHDAQDDEEEEENYDRIVFEGSAEHEALDGFTGVMRGATDGGLPPPMPGSGGWITAENVNQYFDAEGNWIGPASEEEEAEDLGDGAGRVRAREEIDGDTANGHDASDVEAKRARTE